MCVFCYMGSKSFLEKVAEIITDLKKYNPNLIYVKIHFYSKNNYVYVPQELLPLYRDVIVPLADIVTPNQFEAEKLSGISINNQDDALKAIECLHTKGVKVVVISSSDIGKEGNMLTLASTAKNGVRECYKIEFPMLDGRFVGTGDLFAACLLGWIHKSNSIKDAFEKTLSTMQSVIKRTLEHAQKLAGPGNKPTPAQMELRLVQSKSDIENPKDTFKAQLNRKTLSQSAQNQAATSLRNQLSGLENRHSSSGLLLDITRGGKRVRGCTYAQVTCAFILILVIMVTSAMMRYLERESGFKAISTHSVVLMHNSLNTSRGNMTHLSNFP
ncbi:hypothetical protein ScPMuIL_011833 [Solemya velum]